MGVEGKKVNLLNEQISKNIFAEGTKNNHVVRTCGERLRTYCWTGNIVKCNYCKQDLFGCLEYRCGCEIESGVVLEYNAIKCYNMLQYVIMLDEGHEYGI